MIHPLYVGHFARNRSGDRPGGGLKVTKPVNLEIVLGLLAEMGDRQDGRPLVTADAIDAQDPWPQEIGRIGNEKVYFRNGYVECPWLNVGENRQSFAFALRLATELGCHIYEPGDGAFYTPEQLAEMEKEYDRPAPRRPRARKRP